MAKKIYMICLIAITLICMITGVCLYVFMPEVYEKVVPEKVVYENIRFESIEVDAISIDVEIIFGEVYKVAHCCDDDVAPDIRLDGKVLRVGHTHSNESDICKVIITVPNIVLDKTIISIVKGDTHIENIHTRDLQVDICEGNINIADVSINYTANINTGIGDININSVGMHRVNASTSSGNIVVNTDESTINKDLFCYVIVNVSCISY